MTSLELAVELFQIVTAGLRTENATPTPQSIATIEGGLGIRIPDTYQQIASLCPGYGAHLAGIGEDYRNATHILRLNDVFHASAPPLPAHLVMLNLGEDLECFCWDLSAEKKANEYPIVHVGLEEAWSDTPARVRFDEIRYPSFHAYFEAVAIYYGNGVSMYPNWDPKLSARIRDLIKLIEAAPKP